jgi:hypothetical protein
MRNTRAGHSLITSSVVLLAILWGGSSVAQSFGAQSQSTAGRGTDNSTSSAQSGSTPKHKPEKEKHWSGSLVDVNCMMKAMSAPTGATNENSARPNAGSPQKEWLAAGPGIKGKHAAPASYTRRPLGRPVPANRGAPSWQKSRPEFSQAQAVRSTEEYRSRARKAGESQSGWHPGRS